MSQKKPRGQRLRPPPRADWRLEKGGTAVAYNFVKEKVTVLLDRTKTEPESGVHSNE